MPDCTLTAARLRELIDYDPDTGEFRRRTDTPFAHAGDVAGGVNAAGYWRFRVDGKQYRAHRLAWLHVFGVWPSGDLDHRNGDKLDNRISNLREATPAENKQNMRRSNVDNSVGLLGVYPTSNQRWAAKLQVARTPHYLGCFDTAEEAHAAYLAAKAELHPFWQAS